MRSTHRLGCWLAVTILLLVSSGGWGKPALGWEKQVDLELKGTPLRKSLKLIYEDTGLQYAVAPEVPDIPIHLTLRKVNARVALRLFRRHVQSKVPGFYVGMDTEFWVYTIRKPPEEAQRDRPQH